MENEIILSIEVMADIASKINIYNYRKHIYINRQDWPHGSNEYLKINKNLLSSIEEAICVFFLFELYDNEEWWDKDDPMTIPEWKQSIKTFWIPSYFTLRGKDILRYCKVDKEYLKTHNFNNSIDNGEETLYNEVLSRNIIRIFKLDDYQSYLEDLYIIETNDEYIYFNSWVCD